MFKLILDALFDVSPEEINATHNFFLVTYIGIDGQCLVLRQ